MRQVVIIGVMLLTGCVSPGLEKLQPSDLTARARQIQSFSIAICKIEPLLGTVLNILTSGATAPVDEVARDICAAVTTSPLADGPRRLAPTYRGVVIRYRIVK